ncbi:hypothetical protein TruAng_006277 [Truncatella angustata]|nr:hypothetical protein TruAng_006277 [Truncatella angustata]
MSSVHQVKLRCTSQSVLGNKTPSLEVTKEYQTGGHFAQPAGPRLFCDYETTTIWSAPSEVAMRQTQFISYLVARLDGPMETICRSQLSPSYHADSLEQMARKQCFLALATSFYGLAHSQPPVVHHGRRLYLQALNMVNRTISGCDSTGVSETLSSVVALCLHEAIAPTHSIDHSWLRHVDGLEQLFSMHGATSRKSNPLAVALLEVTRPMMIVAALYARRPSLMAQPDWSARAICVPNDHFPPSHRSALAYLLDALAQIPALYHEHDAILSRQSANLLGQTTSEINRREASTSVQALLGRSLSLRDDIHVQDAYWTASNPKFKLFSVSRAIETSTPPYPCKDKIHFSSLQAANVATLYDAVVILINQLVVSSLSLLPGSDVHVIVQAEASEQTSAAIIHIIKSVDFQLSPPGNFYLLFPIRVAHRVLLQSQVPQDIAKRLWLEGVLCSIKERVGTWMSNDYIFGAGKS